MSKGVIAVIGSCLIVLALVGLWYVKRELHYAFAYKPMVERTVRDMVKEECLRK